MHFYVFENLPRDITPRVIEPWLLFQYTLYIQSLSLFIQTFSFLDQSSCYENFQEWQNLKLMKGHLQELLALGYHSAITPPLETKCSTSFIEVGPQT